MTHAIRPARNPRFFRAHVPQMRIRSRSRSWHMLARDSSRGARSPIKRSHKIFYGFELLIGWASNRGKIQGTHLVPISHPAEISDIFLDGTPVKRHMVVLQTELTHFPDCTSTLTRHVRQSLTHVELIQHMIMCEKRCFLFSAPAFQLTQFVFCRNSLCQTDDK